MTEVPKVKIIKYRYECTDEDVKVFVDRPAISYEVIVGFTKYCGLCVGEARARLLNGRYLLEITRDNKNTSQDDRDVNRRFSVIGIADSREAARRTLSSYAQNYAKEIDNFVGLGIVDLTQETPEKEGELAGKVKEK